MSHAFVWPGALLTNQENFGRPGNGRRNALWDPVVRSHTVSLLTVLHIGAFAICFSCRVRKSSRGERGGPCKFKFPFRMLSFRILLGFSLISDVPLLICCGGIGNEVAHIEEACVPGLYRFWRQQSISSFLSNFDTLLPYRSSLVLPNLLSCRLIHYGFSSMEYTLTDEEKNPPSTVWCVGNR